MKTEYKGVTIKTVHGVYTAMGKEYASLAGAKGAITRWVNANVQAVQKQEEAPAPAIEFTNAKNDKGAPIAANPKTAQVYAELDYFSMAKTRDTRSRNKREGKYAGRYKAGDKSFKMANWRTGPKGDYSSLKETAQLYKSLQSAQ